MGLLYLPLALVFVVAVLVLYAVVIGGTVVACEEAWKGAKRLVAPRKPREPARDRPNDRS